MIGAFLAVILIALVGVAIHTRLVAKTVLPSDLPESFGLGLGGVTLLLMALSVLNIWYSPKNLILPVLVLILFLFKSRKVSFKKEAGRSLFWPVLLAAVVMVVAIKAFSLPVWGYDAYATWLARARAFFVDKGITQANMYAFYPYDHPLLWPLNGSFLYTLIGRDSELWIQAIPFAVYLLLLVALARELKPHWSKLWGVFVLALATTPVLLEQVSGGLSGNADLLVAFFIFLGAVNLEKRKWVLGVMLLGLAALTKNDALPAAVMGLIIGLIQLRRKLRQLVVASIPLISLVGFRLVFDLSSRYMNIPERSYLGAFIYSLHAYREEFRFLARWGIIWWGVVALIVTSFSKISVYWKTYLLVAVQLVAYTVIFVTTPEPTPEGHIASALFRLLLHLLPILYLTSLEQVKLVLKSKA